MIHTVFHWLDASESGTSQAEFFLKTVHRYGFTGTHSGELAPELNVEECVRDGQHLTVQQVSDFMERARADTGEAPTLYIRRPFVEECLGGTRALAKYPVRSPATAPAPPNQTRSLAAVAGTSGSTGRTAPSTVSAGGMP